VRRRGPALATTTQMLWVVVAVIAVVWLVLLLFGVLTT
jgi:hypothetical protein